MRRSIGAVLLLAISFVPGFAPAMELEGPIQVRNQFAPFLPISQPYLERASTENSLSFGLSHSSVYVMEDSVRWGVHLDIELTELALRYKRDIPGLFELGVDIPVMRATGGFMDEPLAWYHRAFGFPDYGRSERPRNAFLYEVARNGELLVQGENDRSGFGDIRAAFKKRLREKDPVISLAGTVELPTGNAHIGYGSGDVDYGLAALLDNDIGWGGRIYANAGAVFPGDLKALQTVDLKTFYYAGTGIELPASQDVALIAQVMAQTSPYPKTDISQIDTSAIILVLGGRYHTAHGSYELSLTEDPNTSGAPDFVFALAFKRKM